MVVAVVAHPAADGLQMVRGGRALAQQSAHGVNHAAGIVVSRITRVLQLGGFGHVIHFELFLLGRNFADGIQLRLQPEDVRQDVEIFRRQGRFVVGVFHVGDDLRDDADFFSLGMHVILLAVSFGDT